MTRIRHEAALWIGALTLGGAAIVGAAVLDGQMVVTQSNTGALQIGGPDKPLEAGNGIIFGHAIDAGSSRPVPGAIVTLTSSGFAPVRVMADGQGQFAFTNLPPGKFNLSATRPGYVDGAYGRMRPAGPAQAIDLTANQRVADAAIALWKFAAISGRVSDESGDPLVNANVRVLKRATVAGRRQLVMGASDTTDDRGIYRIGSLEPGDYVVVVPMTQGSRDALLQMAGLPRDLLAALPAGGGGGGGAVFAARVESSSAGGPPVVIDSNDFGAPPAGTSADGRALAYQTEFYPASPNASRATLVSVGSGEERTGIDFQLKPVRTVTLSGTVNAPDGQAADLSLSLVPADADDLVTPIETATTSTDGSGGFRFVNVPPGQYSLRALRSPRVALPGATTVVTQGAGGAVMTSVMTRVTTGGNAPMPPLPTAPTLWADMNVSIGANDLTDLVVPLRQGLRVAGRVEFIGSAIPPAGDQLSGIPISLEAADGRTSTLAGPARGRVDSNATFQTMGVPVGKYVLRVSAPRGWVVRSATFSGQDLIDSAVELREGDISGVVITFTDRPADLSGTVTGANGNPDGTASVIAFPADRALWTSGGSSPRRLKNVRTGKDGSYSLGALPPGEYFLTAVPDAAAADWQNPEFLDVLARAAARVRLDEGEKKTQSLQTARIR